MLTCPPPRRALSPRINTNRFSPWRRVQVLPLMSLLFFTLLIFLRDVQESSHRSNPVAVGRSSALCNTSHSVSLLLSWCSIQDAHVHRARVVFLIKMEVYELTSCAENIVGLWFISVLNNKKEKGNVCYKSQRTQGCFSLIPPQLSIFFLALPGACFSLLSS